MQRLSRTTIALIGGLILLAIAAAYFIATRNPGQDKLTNREVASSTPKPSREKLCASSATYDLIKRELFRRASQLRGSDQAAFDKLSAFAVVRMENPVMLSQDASTAAVNCSGSLALDLPPGVGIIGGRRTLTSDVDYTVAAAADGSGSVVLLRNADAVIAPLATLARVEQSTASPVTPPATNQAPPPQPSSSAPEPPQPAPPPPVPQSPPPRPAPPLQPVAVALARPASAHPSFNCASARRPGEVAVCRDPSLAVLDRRMAAEYGRATDISSPEQRALLRDTAHRFYNYRDRCSTNACIATAYAGRMREIRDIVEGRWQPPR